MRVITTFNDRLYQASGKDLLASLATAWPEAEVLVYEELTAARLDVPTVPIADVPELHRVRASYPELIAPEYGGPADHLTGFNRRWYGWFHKIVAQYDALVRRPTGGLTLFLDSDIRVIAPPSEADLRRTIDRPVGVMQGTREAVESGVIVFDEGTPGPAEFVTHLMDLFLTGEFRRLPRWDDGYVVGVCAKKYPQLACDVAAGRTAIAHTNSNGHATAGQILPVTPWAAYFEHDKGVHMRQGIVGDVTTGRSPLAGLWQSLSGLWSRSPA